MDRHNKVFLGRVKRTVFSLGLVLFILSVAVSPGDGHAQQKVKPEIRLPKDYPDGFDGFGYLNRIAPGEAVINDQLLPVAADVGFNTPGERNTTPALFVPGKIVGFLLDSKGQITSLWMIE